MMIALFQKADLAATAHFVIKMSYKPGLHATKGKCAQPVNYLADTSRAAEWPNSSSK
jgi:hypothetical protein